MKSTEVIEALRNCANVNYEYRAEGASCSKCPYNEVRYCKRTMMHDAADALEAAEKRIAELMYIRIEEVAAVVVQRMEGKDDGNI